MNHNLANREGEQNKLPRIVIISMCIWDDVARVFTSEYAALLPPQLFLDKQIVDLESHHIQIEQDCEIML